MNQYDVIIIGAGAAGLMCAIEAGKRGRSVLLLDHANRIGKKILLSGGGRCNFTNINAGPANFISRNPHFCKSALARYTPQDFIALVERHDIPYHEKKLGQLFCDNSAKDIVAMLADECKKAGARIVTKTDVNGVAKREGGFVLDTSLGELACESLVIATGGLSFPTMGASDFGYRIARQFDIPVLPTCAALVPFTLDEPLKSMAGALSGVAKDSIAQANGPDFRENILFTHRGLSGPAVLQASSYWREGETVHFNLLPGRDATRWLLETKRDKPQRQLLPLLASEFPRRLAEQLLQQWMPDEAQKPLQEIRDAELHHLGERLNDWQVVPSGTEGYRTAEVTLGGVDTNALSQKTMEARKVAGLYFIGEVVDVTGWLGGYNFQWAWASGFCAGQYA